MERKNVEGGAIGVALLISVVIGLVAPPALRAAQSAEPVAEVTFTKDIAPILQRSCQNCHRPDGVAPMSLITYEDVRPWARAIKTRTGLGPKMGVMPPWYIEKNIGIQAYKDDPSLSGEEIAKIAQWADNGAPRGNPADMPPPLQFADAAVWRIGQPDLIVSTPDIVVKANAPDWWGEIESMPIEGLTEDRYVAAIEMKEVNDVETHSGRQTVGGRYVVHHWTFSTRTPDDTDDSYRLSAANNDSSTRWPTHEVGRNPDFFDPKAGRLLRARSRIVTHSTHLHSNGRDTTAHLQVGFKFHPKGYKPEYQQPTTGFSLGNTVDIDIRPMEANQQLHAYAVLEQPTKLITFEPHLHAPGVRMCLEAIWGFNIQTLSCAGYDHNWVRGYAYADDAAPLLPKGTILHIIGYMDTTPANKNVTDTRNWQGGGNRSVANMFLEIGIRIQLTEEQFQKEMAERRKKLSLGPNDVVIGCPLCNAVPKPGYTPAPTPSASGGGPP
jgi:hypothetical protein